MKSHKRPRKKNPKNAPVPFSRFFLKSFVEIAILELVLMHLVFFSLGQWQWDWVSFVVCLGGPYWFIFHHMVEVAIVSFALAFLVTAGGFQSWLSHPGLKRKSS